MNQKKNDLVTTYFFFSTKGSIQKLVLWITVVCFTTLKIKRSNTFTKRKINGKILVKKTRSEQKLKRYENHITVLDLFETFTSEEISYVSIITNRFLFCCVLVVCCASVSWGGRVVAVGVVHGNRFLSVLVLAVVGMVVGVVVVVVVEVKRTVCFSKLRNK